jgi:hypothetical protein
MRSSARYLARMFAVATTAATALTGSGVTAVADPHSGVVDDKFYVVNGTEHAIILASYATGNPYPEWVTPPDRIEPGHKFEVALREFGKSYSVKINFDTFDKNGKQIPGGLVEFRIEESYDNFLVKVACWPGPERACLPRGWGDRYVTTVSFIG